MCAWSSLQTCNTSSCFKYGRVHIVLPRPSRHQHEPLIIILRAIIDACCVRGCMVRTKASWRSCACDVRKQVIDVCSVTLFAQGRRSTQYSWRRRRLACVGERRMKVPYLVWCPMLRPVPKMSSAGCHMFPRTNHPLQTQPACEAGRDCGGLFIADVVGEIQGVAVRRSIATSTCRVALKSCRACLCAFSFLAGAPWNNQKCDCGVTWRAAKD